MSERQAALAGLAIIAIGLIVAPRDAVVLTRIGAIASIIAMVALFTGPRWFCIHAAAISAASMLTVDGITLEGWTGEIVREQWVLKYLFALGALWVLYFAAIHPLRLAYRRMRGSEG